MSITCNITRNRARNLTSIISGINLKTGLKDCNKLKLMAGFTKFMELANCLALV